LIAPCSKKQSLNIAGANAGSADWSRKLDRKGRIVIEPDHRGSPAGGRASAGGGGGGNLTLRVASAVVLAPAVLVCTYVGGWIFLALCAVAAGVVLWEWTSLVAHTGDPRVLAPGWAALLAAALSIGLDRSPGLALGMIALGTIVAAGGAAVWPGPPARRTTPGWAAGGVLYAAMLLLGPALLRRDPEWGLTALLFLFATVWTTDIFAFFCGRAIGGPLLLPSISPKKTWAGAIGGLIGGVAAGIGVAYASGVGKLGIVGVMGLALSVLSQAGDLFESAVKRRFGAKDASHLIPGHGGLMDRIDGFLVAAVAALLIGMLHYGTATPARGLLVW
jgi:phosphatidate cytidylyltransferase